MTPPETDQQETDESALDSLATAITDGDDLIGSEVRAIVTILREADDVLEAIDVSELPEAIDAEAVRQAIELGEIPDALRGDDNADVVKLRQVVRAIDLGRTLAAMDVSQVWESKRAIDDATDELGGDEGGLLDDDDEEGLLGSSDEARLLGGDDEDGVLGGFTDGDGLESELDSLIDTAAEELKEDVDASSGDLSAYQAVIQQQAIEGVDAFRDALLKTHGKFERIVELNRKKMRTQDQQPDSRNPTAVSTLPTGRADVSSVPNYATMPRTVRHSNAPTRSHIYGDRFRREREKRGYDD